MVLDNLQVWGRHKQTDLMGATATLLKEAYRRVDECRSERANLVGWEREEVVGLPMEEEGLESQSFRWVTATSELNTLRTDRVIFFPNMCMSARHQLFLPGLHNIIMSVLGNDIFSQVSMAWVALQLYSSHCSHSIVIICSLVTGQYYGTVFISY